MISSRLVAWIVGVCLALLVFVVVAGVITGQLDLSAVAGVLCALITAVVGGVLARGKAPHNGGEE